MIDPLHVTDYTRSDAELEEFFLFAAIVANKNSDRMAEALDFLLRQGEPGDTPFETIRRMVLDGTLPLRLIQAKTGEYTRRLKTMSEIAAGLVPNLRNATPEDLQQIHGIGAKTARFFIMHTQAGARHAAIDTHIIKFLKAQGWHRVPYKTPTSPVAYRRLEMMFLAECDKAGKSPAEMDLEVWTAYSGRGV